MQFPISQSHWSLPLFGITPEISLFFSPDYFSLEVHTDRARDYVHFHTEILELGWTNRRSLVLRTSLPCIGSIKIKCFEVKERKVESSLAINHSDWDTSYSFFTCMWLGRYGGGKAYHRYLELYYLWAYYAWQYNIFEVFKESLLTNLPSHLTFMFMHIQFAHAH